jgi:hypothetical protein
MPLALRSVLRRHLGRHSPEHFREIVDGATCEWSAHVVNGESVLGEYRNPAPYERTTIVFTDRAIYSFGDPVIRVALESISGHESPANKQTVTGLRIRTDEGFRFLRVSGPQPPRGSAKDAFMLLMVIRAIEASNEAEAKRKAARTTEP